MRALAGWAAAALLCAAPACWAVQEGETAPDFALPAVGGGTVSKQSLSGKVVALAFWATWGRHCAEQLSDLQQLLEEFADAGLAVVAVNEREDAARAGEFAVSHGLTFPVLLDDGTVGRAYGVNGVPDLWVIDRSGTLSAHLVGYGPSSPGQIREAIVSTLAHSAGAPSREDARVPPALRAYAHLQMGAAHLTIGDAFADAGISDLGHYDEALSEFRAGLQLEPRNPDLHIWLGIALERKGDRWTAVREYQNALNLDPTSIYAQEALRRLGVPWAAPSK